MAEDYAKVGIDIEIKGMDTASLSEASAERNYHLLIGSIGAHGVADSDQFIMSHRSGYLSLGRGLGMGSLGYHL